MCDPRCTLHKKKLLDCILAGVKGKTYMQNHSSTYSLRIRMHFVYVYAVEDYKGTDARCVLCAVVPAHSPKGRNHKCHCASASWLWLGLSPYVPIKTHTWLASQIHHQSLCHGNLAIGLHVCDGNGPKLS